MEYGRIAEGDIARVDISLPMDHPANSLVLTGGHAKSRIYMGAPKWGAKEWIGSLYPKRTKDPEFLEQYVKHYNAVELNATHYHIQPSESIAKWAAKAGGHDFLFCPKFIKTISHGGFNNTANLTAQFLESASGFGVHLGPIFLQLSERYGTKEQGKLFGYLESLPKDMLFFLELRHPDWFTDQGKELFDLLRQLKIGAVITDTLGHREGIHMQLTIPKVFIRFMCQGDHPTDKPRIDAWVQRIKTWQNMELERCYFFVHVLNDAFSPEVTRYVAQQFNTICGAGLPPVQFATNLLF